jgi:itaconyl-CoA hydratase
MSHTHTTVGPQRYRERFGRYYEDFEVGDIYEHRPGRTITQADNIWFTLLTMNTHPLHFDEEYGKASEFGSTIVASPFTVALLVGMSVTDVSQKAIANLGWKEIRLSHPVYPGDTLYAESEVLEKRESRKRPEAGVVTVRTIGKNQKGDIVCTFERTILVAKRGHSVEDRINLLNHEPINDTSSHATPDEEQAFVDAIETLDREGTAARRVEVRTRRRVPAYAGRGMKALGLFGATIGRRMAGSACRPHLCADRRARGGGVDVALGHLQLAPDHGLDHRAPGHRGAEARLPAALRDRRAARRPRPDRTRLRHRPARHPHTARRDGDHYVVNGTKTWISNGIEGSCYAAGQDRRARQPRGGRMSMLLAEKGPGFTVGGSWRSSATRAIDSASSSSTTTACRPTG